MSVKLLVISLLVIAVMVFVAFYTRLINIDKFARRDKKRSYQNSISVYNLESRFQYGSVGEGFLINDYQLRIYSSCIPPAVLTLNFAKKEGNIIAGDISGKKFLLGRVIATELKDDKTYWSIAADKDDRVVFSSSYSLIPYYHGFSFFLSGPLSRYYHYYSLNITKKSGATLMLEWKFSTYKGADGNFVPDLFGDNQEGLVKAEIKER
jgi:hypothetical protein